MNGEIRALKAEMEADREIYRAEVEQFLSFLGGLLSTDERSSTNYPT